MPLESHPVPHQYSEGYPEFQKGISKEGMELLLAGAGNNEIKALIVCVMETGIWTPPEISKRLHELRGEDSERWPMDNLVQVHLDTLAGVGFLDRELIDTTTGRSNGYELTEFGKKYGIPFASAMLEFSLAHPHVSLRDMLGSAASVVPAYERVVEGETVLMKKRGPSSRLEIYRALLTATLPVSQVQIHHDLKAPEDSLIAQLQNLGANHIITRKTDGVRTMYRINSNKLRTERQTPLGLTQSVIDFLYLANGYASIDQICSGIYDEFGDYYQHDPARLRTAVTQTIQRQLLQGTVETGLLNKKDGFAQISLTPQQRATIYNLVSTVYEFQSASDQDLRDKAYRGKLLLAQPVSISTLIDKLRSSSSHANTLTSAQKGSFIIEALKLLGEPVSTTHIHEVVSGLLGRSISNRVIQETLKILLESGTVKTAQGHYWLE